MIVGEQRRGRWPAVPQPLLPRGLLRESAAAIRPCCHVPAPVPCASGPTHLAR
jgi:hypothetical protein